MWGSRLLFIGVRLADSQRMYLNEVVCHSFALLEGHCEVLALSVAYQLFLKSIENILSGEI